MSGRPCKAHKLQLQFGHGCPAAMVISADTSAVVFNKAERTFILKISYLNFLKDSTGNSKESSITIILCLGIISNIKLPSNEVLPDPGGLQAIIFNFAEEDNFPNSLI